MIRALLALSSLVGFSAYAQVANIGLTAGQSVSINSSVLQQYGGAVNVSCNPPTVTPPVNAPPPSTLNLGANCGSGQGFCDCSSNQPGYPDVTKAQGLCQDFGFRTLISYRISPAPMGYNLCSGLKGACIVNNTPGTVFCSTITCSY